VGWDADVGYDQFAAVGGSGEDEVAAFGASEGDG
jgi:hypothetical protein